MFQRDIGVDFETLKEAPDGFKEFKEGVIALADLFDRLV